MIGVIIPYVNINIFSLIALVLNLKKKQQKAKEKWNYFIFLWP